MDHPLPPAATYGALFAGARLSPAALECAMAQLDWVGPEGDGSMGARNLVRFLRTAWPQARWRFRVDRPRELQFFEGGGYRLRARWAALPGAPTTRQVGAVMEVFTMEDRTTELAEHFHAGFSRLAGAACQCKAAQDSDYAWLARRQAKVAALALAAALGRGRKKPGRGPRM